MAASFCCVRRLLVATGILIVGYGAMGALGVVVDGQVVHAGGMPSRGKIEQWLD